MAEVGQSQQTYMDPVKRELLNFLVQQSMGLISGVGDKPKKIYNNLVKIKKMLKAKDLSLNKKE